MSEVDQEQSPSITHEVTSVPTITPEKPRLNPVEKFIASWKEKLSRKKSEEVIREIAALSESNEQPVVLEKPVIEDTVSTENSEPKIEAWVASLPIPEIHGPNVGDVKDTGELLERYASHWNGSYDQETETLTLEPKKTPDVVENNGVFYDKKLATLENGVAVPIRGGEYKPIETGLGGHVTLSEEECPSVENGNKLIFRGINYEGMQRAIKEGELNAGPIMKSHGVENVYFAPNAQRSFLYAAEGESSYASATFEKPSYVVVANEPDEPNIDQFGDIVVESSVDLKTLKKIYEVRPYEIKKGQIPGVRDVREGMSADEVKRMEEMGRKPYMELPDIFVQMYNGPKTKFAYREISLDELKESFSPDSNTAS